MGKETSIEWTEATWNPFHGCLKVSPGCQHCYMYRDKRRYSQNPMDIQRSKPATFNAPLNWKEPRVIFTCSWSDWFIEQADEWRNDAWDVIRRTPQHTYQILTKRADRIADHLPDDWGAGWPNVWLGVSIENQEYADRRIPHLLQVPAAVRFLSCEPLLEAIDLGGAVGRKHGSDYHDKFGACTCDTEKRIDWVIVGGESGPHARPMHPDWARGLRDQCQAAGVAFHFKQHGEWLHESQTDKNLWESHCKKTGEVEEVGKHVELGGYTYKVGKARAGRLLDGRTHDEFPQGAAA